MTEREVNDYGSVERKKNSKTDKWILKGNGLVFPIPFANLPSTIENAPYMYSERATSNRLSLSEMFHAGFLSFSLCGIFLVIS